MQNGTIFFAYLTCWVVYLIAAYVWGHRKQLSLGLVSVSHFVPSAVAVSMIYVFLICRGTNTWEMWESWLWLSIILALATVLSAFINLVLTIVWSVKKSRRTWVPVTFVALLMSVFALMTVFANFPTV